MSSSPTPAWIAFLCGWLWAQAAVAWWPAGGRAAQAPVCQVAGTAEGALPLGPRRLRQLRGVGTGRALTVARELWRQPALAQDPQTIPGIGPVTGAVLREFFDGRRRSMAASASGGGPKVGREGDPKRPSSALPVSPAPAGESRARPQ